MMQLRAVSDGAFVTLLVEINADPQPIMSLNGFSLPKTLEISKYFVILKNYYVFR